MALPNTFDKQTTALTLKRLEGLQHNTKPQWGKMNAPQMLAHLNVSYDMAEGKIPVRNNFIVSFMLKTFIKKIVTNEVPYKKNSRTAPQFVITNEREFEKEKQRFIQNIKKVEEQGAAYFEGKQSVSFGPLTAKEWSNMFYKHIDHHFSQFGI
jgi:hypothetical protein